MNRILSIFFFLLLSLTNTYSQSFYGSQYFVGTPVNDSITSTPLSDPGPGGCYPSASYTVGFPESKISGVVNYMLITAVSPGNSAYTTQKGTVHIGDTLPFTSNSPDYDFYFPKGGGIIYEIKASGKPAIAGESYSCGQFVETTKPSGCPDIISYTFIQSAKVQVNNGNVSHITFKIVPLVNLTAASFSTSTNVTIDPSVNLKDARIEMYDTYGRKTVSNVVTTNTFTLGRKGIPNGTYFWKVINDKETIGLGKVNITQ